MTIKLYYFALPGEHAHPKPGGAAAVQGGERHLVQGLMSGDEASGDEGRGVGR